MSLTKVQVLLLYDYLRTYWDRLLIFVPAITSTSIFCRRGPPESHTAAPDGVCFVLQHDCSRERAVVAVVLGGSLGCKTEWPRPSAESPGSAARQHRLT